MKALYYKIKEIVLKNKYWIGSTLLIPFLFIVSFRNDFKRIMDKTVKVRTTAIQFLVVHYTANTNPGADASANARYLKNKRAAGTHYCIDDLEIIQCTDEDNIAFAVGDRKWRGFVPKPWYSSITNGNSLSFEMCLGGGRNDSLILDSTAQLIGHRMIKYGLDISRVVRHHDVSGKHCPRFCYTDPEWNQIREDSSFIKFKEIVYGYYQYNLERKRIWRETKVWPDTLPNVGTIERTYNVEGINTR